MFRKFSTAKLLVILVVLIGLAALNKFYFSEKSESTFSDEFVKIDTGLVNEILIYPKAENGKEIKLSRQPKGWELQFGELKTDADTAAVRNLLGSFAEIRSNSLASADRSGWAELQIDDTSGSRIKFITGDKKPLEMVVGKFGFNAASRSGITYIRHAGEEAVYAIDGFLSFSVNQPHTGWRNKQFISGNKGAWNTLTFTYPGDSSFVLAREHNSWMVNGQPADSAKAEQYLDGIAAMQNSGFVDSYSPDAAPLYTLRIQGNNLAEPITVVAYPADTVQKLILHSSQNKDAFFSEAKSQLAGRIFVGRTNFMAQ